MFLLPMACILHISIDASFVVVIQSLSCVWLFATPWTAPRTRLPCASLFPWVCSNSCPWGQWCQPTISSSVAPFSCPQCFLASGSFLMSWLFASGGHSIEASASASVLPMNNQGWFPLGLTGLISLLSKGLSRVFSSSTVWKHRFWWAIDHGVANSGTWLSD